MRSSILLLVTIVLGLCWIPSRAKGDLIVESWELDTGIHDSSPNGDSEFAAFSVVMNPLQNSHTASIANTNTSATYDFGWTGDSAHFDLITNHHQEQLRGNTIAEGRIHLIPSVDSTINAWGSWQYAWPNSAEGLTTISFNVVDLETKELIAIDNAYGGNLDLGPPFGTLSIQGSGLLLAGREYEVFYATNVYFYTTTPTGEASGEIHFTITPVPEPAALALILPALLLPRRKRF